MRIAGMQKRGNNMNDKVAAVGAMLVTEIPKTKTLVDLRALLREGLLMLQTDEPVTYGCHCDLEPGMAPDGCVLDYGRPEDCVHAPALVAAHKGREECEKWRPVAILVTPNV